MDSIKQYNLAGVASEVELGKRGAKIDGTSRDKVSLKKRDGSLTNAEIADGTEENHAITQSQLLDATSSKLSDYDIQVSFDDGEVNLGTIRAGSTVLRVSVEKGAGNWIGADSDTNITVGTTENNSLLFTGFDPETQSIDETNYEFSADADLKVFVSAGSATSGSAVVRVVYAGTFIAS